MHYIFMNNKQAKQVVTILQEQYDAQVAFEGGLALHTKDNKIMLISRDVTQIDINILRVNSLGLYIGQFNNAQTQIRLSIEGSQLIGKSATKNILELSDDEFQQYIKGENLIIDTLLTKRIQDLSEYILVKHGVDYYGVCRIKDDSILNFTPKNRRIMGGMIGNTSEIQNDEDSY